MKRLAIFDPYLYKFSQDMVDWWRAHDYEVKIDRYYDPRLVQWADVVWFDTCDNNLKSATNPDEALLASWLQDGIDPVDMHAMDLRGKKIIVRPIDIEVWQGHHAGVIWDVVTDCVFIAPHIRDMMMLDSRPQASEMKVHTIPCGVNLDKWTFKKRQPGGKIGVVAERWVSKGVDYVIQIAMKLPEGYTIHWLGKNNDYHWERDYLEDMIKRHNLPIILEEEFVDDLNAWWEDKNYALLASKKEAFSYATAEAMAKGIKPILHQFLGYEPLWGDMPTWAFIDEAVEMITEDKYDSKSYRQFLIDHGYTVDAMMNKIEEVING